MLKIIMTPLEQSGLTPTELPRKKSVTQIIEKEFEKEASKPKMVVKKSVQLKAALRPTKSEPFKQPTYQWQDSELDEGR